jgi:hypothetical protein
MLAVIRGLPHLIAQGRFFLFFVFLAFFAVTKAALFNRRERRERRWRAFGRFCCRQSKFVIRKQIQRFQAGFDALQLIFILIFWL